MRVESSVTSVSWIPSEAIKGMVKMPFEVGVGHYDEPLPDVVDVNNLEVMRDNDQFRFANHLRAWIRAAQLRSYLDREVSGEWWESHETGDRLRALFTEGTKPTSEEIAGRLGFDPFDTGPLVANLSAA